jgi:RecA/RadA recombinase
MPVSVIGNYPELKRARTGLYSLDRAFASRGNLGVPLRTILELYGYTNSGKSSLAYYLSGSIAKKGNVTVCDLEAADPEYIKGSMENAGLDGTVRIVDVVDDKGEFISHEVMLQDMVTSLEETGTRAVILDSIGGIIPVAEASGDFGEANMGRRAKLVAQVSRAMNAYLRVKTEPAIGIVINHVHSVIGGRGHVTAGGEALKYLAASRVMIWPTERFTETNEHGEEEPIGFLVSGKLEKLRYGGPGREFQYYIVPGYGVHEGASAMFDCFSLGLAKRDTTVKLDGKSMGYLKKDLLLYAHEGKQRKFEPFVEALKEHENSMRLKLIEETVEDKGNGYAEKPKRKTRTQED